MLLALRSPNFWERVPSAGVSGPEQMAQNSVAKTSQCLGRCSCHKQDQVKHVASPSAARSRAADRLAGSFAGSAQSSAHSTDAPAGGILSQTSWPCTPDACSIAAHVAAGCMLLELRSPNFWERLPSAGITCDPEQAAWHSAAEVSLCLVIMSHKETSLSMLHLLVQCADGLQID